MWLYDESERGSGYIMKVSVNVKGVIQQKWKRKWFTMKVIGIVHWRWKCKWLHNARESGSGSDSYYTPKIKVRVKVVMQWEWESK